MSTEKPAEPDAGGPDEIASWGSDPSPPPAPGWWLASDGNWYPPQATPGGPPPAGMALPPPVAQEDSSGPSVVVLVLAGIGTLFLILVFAVVAITFLGQKASSKFSSVGSPVAGTVIVIPH